MVEMFDSPNAAIFTRSNTLETWQELQSNVLQECCHYLSTVLAGLLINSRLIGSCIPGSPCHYKGLVRPSIAVDTLDQAFRMTFRLYGMIYIQTFSLYQIRNLYRRSLFSNASDPITRQTQTHLIGTDCR